MNDRWLRALAAVTRRGMERATTEQEKRIVLITNSVLWMAFPVGILRSFYFFASGDRTVFLISLAASLLFLVLYELNARGFFNAAKFTLLFIGNAATLASELNDGARGHQLFLILACFAVVFLLFPLDRRKTLLAALAVPSAAMALALVAPFWFPSLVGQPASPTKDVSKIPGVLSGVVLIIPVIWYFVHQAFQAENRLRKSYETLQELHARTDRQHREIESLLRNILPDQVAVRLRAGETPLVDHLENVSVVFIDIEGFTRFSSSVTPKRLIAELNRIFRALDGVAGRHKMEKIKTIGDCYMAAAGVPHGDPDHVRTVAAFSLDALDRLAGWTTKSGAPLRFRIGVATGGVVAGVIGEKKFSYDLWGDTVNVASRMESTGEPGLVHCTDLFKRRLEETDLAPRLRFTDRGTIPVKGKGDVKTWFFQKAAKRTKAKRG